MDSPTDDNTNKAFDQPHHGHTEHFDEQPAVEPVIVEPLPFQEETTAVLSNAEYTAATIAEHEDEPVKLIPHVRNLIHTYLDEIDTASSIPGADSRIRSITRKIRNII